MNNEIKKAWVELTRQRIEAAGKWLQEVAEKDQVMECIAPIEQCDTADLTALAQGGDPSPGEGYYALDVGCGFSSRIGRSAFGKPVTVVGVDALSMPLMEILSRSRLPMPHPIINVLAEEMGLIWPAGAFDLIVCKNSLHHFVDPVTALSSMARLLKPGASLRVTMDQTEEDPLALWEPSARAGVASFKRGDLEVVASRASGVELEVFQEGRGIEIRARRPAAGLVLAR